MMRLILHQACSIRPAQGATLESPECRVRPRGERMPQTKSLTGRLGQAQALHSEGSRSSVNPPEFLKNLFFAVLLGYLAKKDRRMSVELRVARHGTCGLVAGHENEADRRGRRSHTKPERSEAVEGRCNQAPGAGVAVLGLRTMRLGQEG
jgi:hypothetical protein